MRTIKYFTDIHYTDLHFLITKHKMYLMKINKYYYYMIISRNLN
jgi:hypothetical protein